MNTLKFIVVVSIALLSTGLVYHQVVNGFVDGNNNGRDDVEEWENSPDYWLGMSSKEDDKSNRQIQCDIFNGIWNNTGDGSCKYTQGNNTCILSGGVLSANENPKCVPAGQNK